MSRTEPFWFLHPSSPIHGSSTTPFAWPTSPSSPIAAPPPPSHRIPSPPHLPPWLLHCPCLRHRCLPVQATLHPSSDPAATNSMAPNPASLVGGRVARAGRKSAAVAGDRVTVNGAAAATDPSTPVVDLALGGADLASDCPLRRQLVEAGDATAVADAGGARWKPAASADDGGMLRTCASTAALAGAATARRRSQQRRSTVRRERGGEADSGGGCHGGGFALLCARKKEASVTRKRCRQREDEGRRGLSTGGGAAQPVVAGQLIGGSGAYPPLLHH